MASRTYTLFALETADSTPLDDLLTRVADAVVDVTTDGAVHSIVLDKARMRDTVAAGHAYAAGYISHTS